MQNTKKPHITIIGTDFSSRPRESAREFIAQRLLREGGAPSLVFTPNTDIALRCARSEKLAALINSADLVIPDGGGIVLASKILRTPLSGRISGIDTGEFILSVAAENGLSVFFLGGKGETAKIAAEKMQIRYPGLKICGARHGYFEKSGAENAAVVSEINAARPEIIFACLGFPAQEAWLAENAANIPSLRLGIGLGGSLDVWSGGKKRAPALMRGLYLEWLWRGLLEPRRLKIMLRFPEFFLRVLGQRRSAKKRARGSKPQNTV